MKVAIPVLETEVKGRRLVNAHFGRTPLFLIYDTESQEEKLVKNPRASLKNFGMGAGGGRLLIELAQREAVDAFLVKGIGEGAFYNLEALGVKFYLVPKSVKFADEALKLFKEGKLERLSQPYEEDEH